MRKRPALIACLAVLAVAVAAGIVFYVGSANERRLEEQAVKEKQQEILNDLFYANRYNFTCYTNSGEFLALSLASMAREDPAKYTRIDFCDERPAGFEFEKIEDGVIIAVPTDKTQRSLDRLNYLIGQYNVDATAFGFGPELTIHDMPDRQGVRALIDRIQGGTPEETAALRDSIYNPG